MESAGEVATLTDQMEHVDGMVAELRSSTDTLRAETDPVRRSVAAIHDASDRNTRAITEVFEATQALVEHAHRLREQLARFRLPNALRLLTPPMPSPQPQAMLAPARA